MKEEKNRNEIQEELNVERMQQYNEVGIKWKSCRNITKDKERENCRNII